MLNRLYLSHIARLARSFGRSIPAMRFSAASYTGKSFDEAWEELDDSGKAMIAFGESWPSTPKVAVFKGAACLGSGEPALDFAYDSFERAIKMQPNCVEALIGKAITHEIAEQYDLAKADLRKATTIDRFKAKETYERYVKLAVESYPEESKVRERIGKLLPAIAAEVDRLEEELAAKASAKYRSPQPFKDHFRTPPASDSDNGIYILK
jgi:hypothetical protein